MQFSEEVTSSEIYIILHIVRQPNSKIILLFILNISSFLLFFVTPRNSSYRGMLHGGYTAIQLEYRASRLLLALFSLPTPPPSPHLLTWKYLIPGADYSSSYSICPGKLKLCTPGSIFSGYKNKNTIFWQLSLIE